MPHSASPTQRHFPAKDELISPAAAAQIANRSVRTIRRAYLSGRLSAYRDRGGRGVRILYGDLRQWMMGEEIALPDHTTPTPTPAPSAAVPPGSASANLENSLSLIRAARSSRRRDRRKNPRR
jgi:hypothetical protein